VGPTKSPLKAVAQQLYRRKGGGQSALLEHLREGNLQAVMVFPRPGGALQPIPKSVWVSMQDREFKVRYKSHGRWCSRLFEISIDFAVDAALIDIKKGLEAAFRRDADQLLSVTLRHWGADIPSKPPATNEEWLQIHQVLVSALKVVSELRGHREPVYVTDSEQQKFFQDLSAAPRGPGGRKALPSDVFWMELISELHPPRPTFSQKTLIQSIIAGSSSNGYSESWVKQRVQELYKKMGW
jgi:hypothetical protein